MSHTMLPGSGPGVAEYRFLPLLATPCPDDGQMRTGVLMLIAAIHVETPMSMLHVM
jgi:hypothetical protein